MNEMVQNVLKDRYFQPGETKWDDIAMRVARAIAFDSPERKKFFDIISDKRFIPNSPTLMNAGTEMGQLSACFVIPVEDSIEGIGRALTNSMLISKSGGGVGYSFGRLRAAGSKVKTTSGVASGPISFMKIFNTATEAIKQGGKRRGANMGVLPISHPDIEEFIDCKKVDGELSNFNISVGITDRFMECVNNGTPYTLRDGKQINASLLLNKIADNMWSNGEPGVIFLDTINNNSPFEMRIEATNPCGEQPLPPWGSCNLGSIDVSRYVANGEFDYGAFRDDVFIAVDILNRILDVNKYPLPELKEFAMEHRPIGLGIMGFADALIKMKMVYGSPESITFAHTLMHTMYKAAEAESLVYSQNNNTVPNTTLLSMAPTGTISMIAGCSSGIEPNFAYSYERRIKNNEGEVKYYTQYHPLVETGMDDSNLPEWFVTAFDVAPEDHIMMQAAFQRNCDTGISKTINVPTNATKKNVVSLINQAWQSECKGFTMYRDGSRENQVLTVAKEDVKAGQLVTGTAAVVFDETSEYKSKDVALLVEAVKPDGDVIHISTPVLKNGDTISITGTWSLSEEDMETMKELDSRIGEENYIGSMEAVAAEFVEDKNKKMTFFGPDSVTAAKNKREEVMSGKTYKMTTGCGTLYITVNAKNGRPYEVFVKTGGTGGCQANLDALARMISMNLRYEVPVDVVVKHLKRVKCDMARMNKDAKGKSCADIIGKCIEESAKVEPPRPNVDWIKVTPYVPYTERGSSGEYIYTDPTGTVTWESVKETTSDCQCDSTFCPECGNPVMSVSGCISCSYCGYSKCS